jgi:putative spermidine/putrescine transport system permease protein
MKARSNFGAWQLSLLTVAVPTALLVAVFFIPFVHVIAEGLFQNGRFTAAGFEKVRKLYVTDIFYTVYISAVSLVITIFFTVLLGGFFRLYAGKFMAFLFKIPLFVPYVVVGHAMRTFLAPHGTLNSLLSLAGLISLENPPSLAFSSTGIVIALVWKNMAFALLLVMAPFQRIHDSYIQAAQNAGAGFFRLLKDILVPMARKSIFVTAVILFTSMMGSFSIPMMIGSGEGPQMIMTDIYYRLVYQNDLLTANALGILSFILSCGAAWYYVRKVVDE